MTGALFTAAAGAAGALALSYDPQAGALTLAGDPSRLHLPDPCTDLAALKAAAAPGDRALLDALSTASDLDARLRLIGTDGQVRYARLVGSGEAGVWRGLLIPAGAGPTGGRARMDLEAALEDALSAGDVVAYHQPIVSLSTRRLAGFEALARWVRPDGEITAPDDFLPLAAEKGLTATLGRAVRRAAASDAAAWREGARLAGLGVAEPLFMAANATAGEICTPGFADTLLAMLEETGLPPRRFKLELSESEVMRDPDAAEIAMKAIRAAGVSLALDDFGTGYSSLSRLDRFPFDTVKIDQYFVRAALADAAARAIVKSVVTIARSYSMTIVAEGVETQTAAAMCTDLGCDFGQGWRFSRALKPEDAATAVRSGIEDRFKPAQD
ncbi:MAG: EAL domain-containing protein [Oceanicaulis sp.]